MYLYKIKFVNQQRSQYFVNSVYFPYFGNPAKIIFAQSVLRQFIWITSVLDIVYVQSTTGVNEIRENMVVSRILLGSSI